MARLLLQSSFSEHLQTYYMLTRLCRNIQYIQCESKKSPPYGFLKFFPKRLGIFNQFLHTYYTIISILEYKFLFKYLHL